MAVLLKGRPVSTQTLFANKRTVLLGLPGAFTPNCHMYHVPPYVEHAQDFVDAGVDQIVAFTVNDVFCTRCVKEEPVDPDAKQRMAQADVALQGLD